MDAAECNRLALTHEGEEKDERAFEDLQAALRRSAAQPGRTDVLVSTGGVPQRVLGRPPEAAQ